MELCGLRMGGQTTLKRQYYVGLEKDIVLTNCLKEYFCVQKAARSESGRSCRQLVDFDPPPPNGSKSTAYLHCVNDQDGAQAASP